MVNHSIIQKIRDIPPFVVKKYLIATGWREVVGIKRKGIFLFQRPENTSKQVIIPNANDYDCYGDDLLDSIRQIQQIVNTDTESVLAHLIHPDMDILRYRLISPQADSGALSLSVVNKFIAGVIDSLKASVCDCSSPSRHHTRMGNKQVDELLEKSQFGQTEHGSFVVKVLSPVDTNALGGGVENKMRRSILHLLQGADKLVQIIENDGVKDFLQESQETPIVSDNFVNALVDMQLWDDASVEISVEWTPNLLPVDNPPTLININPSHFRELDKVSMGLAPDSKKMKPKTYFGFVTRLDGSPNDQNRQEGEVCIDIVMPDQDSIKVFVNLNQDEYDMAIDAHRRNALVGFNGKLERKSARRMCIKDIADFKIVPEITGGGDS